ncbi:MAG: GntR family transcriptional regulator [Alkalibacterium sp.]|nr:GntR family transcriptional regulator [Alkalibacterium sp.]TVP91191.1 MAG: GntR family transcriptional regulator [Alkalibacterium sp.]
MERKRKYEDKAYSYMKKRIENGEWKTGRQLKELEVAELVDSSRTPVRKAFARLEVEGLVSVIPRKGVFVASSNLGLKDIKDRLYTLEALFQHILFTLEQSEAVINGVVLETSLHQMKTSLEHSSAQFEASEIHFWEAVFSYHDNGYLNELVLKTLRQLQQVEPDMEKILIGSRQTKYTHYQLIKEKIESGDYVYARREIRILLNQLLINMIQGID